MGFFKNIGRIAKDSALGAVTNSIRQTQLSLGTDSLIDIDSNGVDVSLNKLFGSNQNTEIVNTGTPKLTTNVVDFNQLDARQKDRFSKVVGYAEDEDTRLNNRYSNNFEDQESDEYSLTIPNWSYDDFINERNIFLKHISNGFDEPGWFYFKLFFDFDSKHGLFGGILQAREEEAFASVNSAYQYLKQSRELFKHEKLYERAISLAKFTNLLSFINVNAPWFFSGVKNLSAASNPQIDKFGEEKYIEVELAQEAIDMRITTLMSLYKFACYDDINNKEIIPENLRKFDMCLVIFSSPIKYIHGVANNKSTTAGEHSMSFKLYRFFNCEIDIENFGNYITSDIKNEQPFELGKNTIKIKYDRVYEYNMNEYMGILLGSDGIYLDNPNITTEELSDLVDQSENFVHTAFNSLFKSNTNFVLGNIRGQDLRLYEPNMDSSSTKKEFTEYAKAKYGIMNSNKNSNWITTLGYDVLYKLLGTGYNASANVLKVNGKVIGDGTVLNGHGNYRVGSAVWRAKMQRMVNGKQGLSDREYRLTTVGIATETNWAQKLHDMAVNSTSTLGFI